MGTQLKGKIPIELNAIKESMNKNHDMSSIKITKHEIISQVWKLKTGKSCGVDDIINEFLEYGGEAITNTLANLFTFISDMETIPDE